MTKITEHIVVLIGPAFNYPQCPYAGQQALIIRSYGSDLLLEIEHSGQEVWIDENRTTPTGELVNRSD